METQQHRIDNANFMELSFIQKSADLAVIVAGISAVFMDVANGVRGVVVWVLPFISLAYIAYRWAYVSKLKKQQEIHPHVREELKQ